MAKSLRRSRRDRSSGRELRVRWVHAPSNPPATRAGQGLRLLVVALPVVVVLAGAWAHRWTHEDGFINFRIVDQILSGHGPVFNEGERVEAFTSPLWLAVLVQGRLTLGLLMRLEWVAVTVGIIATGVAFLLSSRAAGRVHGGERPVLPLGVLLVAALPPVWDFATSGLEMSLVWLWLAASWWVLLLAATATERLVGSRRLVFLAVLGLGPLVRPDLALMTAVFVGGWAVIMRPSRRRLLVDLGAAVLLPGLYQVFRMGYYAAPVPNTALAKGASDHFVFAGVEYLQDLVDPYWLWIPLLPLLVALGTTLVRGSGRVRVACLTMVGAAVAHGGYIVYVGGDYMHARLSLPALFALALPAVVVLDGSWWGRAAMAVGFGWAIVCIGWIRYDNPPRGFVGDQRAFLPASERLIHYPSFGRAAEASYDRGERGLVPALYGRVDKDGPPPVLPVGRAGVDELILVTDAIGQLGYEAGPNVYILDRFGLAEPLTARADVAPDEVWWRPAGHRTRLSPEWYAARFDAPSVGIYEPIRPPALRVARRALSCPPLSDVLAGITEPLTVGRFLSNAWHSVSFARVRVSPDPLEGPQDPCRGG